MSKLNKIVERYKENKMLLLFDIIFLGCAIKIFFIIVIE